MPETDAEEGSRLDDTADMTLPWLTGSRWQTADILASDATGSSGLAVYVLPCRP